MELMRKFCKVFARLTRLELYADSNVVVAAFKCRARAVSVIEYDPAKLHAETAANSIFGIRAERIAHAERKHVKVNDFTAN